MAMEPVEEEQEVDFINRCVLDSDMKKMYPDDGERKKECEERWGKWCKKKKKKKKKKRSTQEVERRYTGVEEFRFDEDGNTISGYAARFNVWSEPIGGYFREKIKKGAFAKTIQESDIRLLFNHDPNYILARTQNETLSLKEDNKGLFYEAKLPDTTYAKDLKESIRRGDISQNSFAFITLQDKWDIKEGKEMDERTLLEVKLQDVSPVTFPAYPQTDVKIRSVLQDVGIDYDALGLVITRAERDIEISDIDKNIIQTAIAVLNEYLTNSEPIEEDHSDGEIEPDYTTLLRLKKMNQRVKKLLGTTNGQIKGTTK